MQTVYRNPRLLAFQDHQAPQRGSWVVYASQPERGFIACHEIEDGTKTPRLLEQRTLDTLEELRQFAAQLNGLGWSAQQPVMR